MLLQMLLSNCRIGISVILIFNEICLWSYQHLPLEQNQKPLEIDTGTYAML